MCRVHRRRARCLPQALLGLVRGLLADDTLVNSLALGLSHHLLRLVRVLVDGLRAHLHGLASMLRGQITHLLALLADDVAGVLEV